MTLPICVGVATGICRCRHCKRGMGACQFLLTRHRRLVIVLTGSGRTKRTTRWCWRLTGTSDEAFFWEIKLGCWFLWVSVALFVTVHNLVTFCFWIRIWNANFLMIVWLCLIKNSRLSKNYWNFILICFKHLVHLSLFNE